MRVASQPAPPSARVPALRRALMVVVVLLVALLAGCGEQYGPAGTSGTPTASSWTTPDLKVAGKPGNEARAVWGMPSGAFAGKLAKAVLLIIHGGGWRGNDPVQFRASEAAARGYQKVGYATVAVEYRAGRTGIEDVDRIYAAARRRAGPDVPICALGGSAGGHVALMLAVRHADLACVIGDAAPTDLTAYPKMGPGGRQAVAGFVGQLAKYSPVRHARSIRAKLLLAYAENDSTVPVSQGRAMKRADPALTLVVLPPGPTPFVHSGVTSVAKARLQAQKGAFLDEVARQRGSGGGG